jgi:ATP-dependent DNA helicase RecG
MNRENENGKKIHKKKEDVNNIPIKDIKGIGSKIAAKFEKKGIKTVEDLFYFLPIRYEDRRDTCNICDVKEGEKVSVVGTVTAYKSLFFRHSRRKAFEAIVEDSTGLLSIKWFQWNRHYLKSICRKGNLLLLSGEVKSFGAQLQMIHPDVTIIDDEDDVKSHKTIMPIYSEIEGVKQGVLRNIIKEAFESFGGQIQSVVPESTERIYGLVPLGEAFRGLHFPDDGFSNIEYRISNIERLIFEEYFLFQAALLLKKRERKQGRGIRFKTDGCLYRRFREGLPFELTDAQKRVVGEIEHDMALDEPMNRLIQGDVGCGKTICAVMASCIAVDNECQVAFMAPTEILAEQHYLSVHRFFDGLGVSVAFLRGNMGKQRKDILRQIREGRTSIIIGTHALIQKDVKFHRLGLVIIDEQHRFGVLQRKMLKDRGKMEEGRVQGVKESRGQGEETTEAVEDFQIANRKSQFTTKFIPHTLVMSATPIPRTLSMVIYGDLDVSVIDELPKGRQKIWTKVYLEQNRPAVYRMMEDELKHGKQVFIVYPLVDESDKMELLNAKDMAVHLQKTAFPSYKIGLIHGRMKPQEKERVMERFKDGNIDILVCTTVIEVGIDVPNATMIVIEHAERFGLSQLHQLRGRVGRGAHASKCILITSTKRTDIATKRLKTMEDTSDGFKIAEEDMKIRGPGEMLGQRQSGIPDFRVGDVVKDIDIMIEARKAAKEALDVIGNEGLAIIKDKVNTRWKSRIDLVDIS